MVAGRNSAENHGFVNPPVIHASTVLYPNAADMVAHRARYQYGRRGTPTSEALEDALRAIEGPGCAGVCARSVGRGGGFHRAAFGRRRRRSPSDHRQRLSPDPRLCRHILKKLGVETTYYDPLIGAGIAKLMRPNTRAVFVEAPGSQSFEMQDIPAIAQVARAKGAIVLMDNTWGTPLYFRAFEKGVDISIQAGTKYIGGHSDLMLGTISANAATLPKIKDTRQYARPLRRAGRHVSRAARTAHARAFGSSVTRDPRSRSRAGSQQRPEVLRVMHPALESDPGHAIWKRDFLGASGLFSLVLKPAPEKAVHAFLEQPAAVRHGLFMGRL